MNLLVAAVALLAAVSAAQTPEAAPRRVEVHLFGGDMTAGAPLAWWYHDIGITDLWLYPFRGAFPQDQRPEDQKTPEQVTELLAAYRQHHLRCWWMERPVPDVFYQTARGEGRHLWDASPESWQAVQYAGTDTAGSYLQALCEFSAAGTR